MGGVACAHDFHYILASPPIPRIALSPVIKDMQAIRREAQALELPTCARNAQNRLIDYMDVSINAFAAFMAQKPNSEVAGMLDAVKTRRAQYDAAVDALASVPGTVAPSQ